LKLEYLKAKIIVYLMGELRLQNLGKLLMIQKLRKNIVNPKNWVSESPQITIYPLLLMTYQETGDLSTDDRDSGYFRDHEQKSRFFAAYPASPAVSPIGLQKGRANLLLVLSKERFQSISKHKSISFTEKRWLEKQLIEKVNECKSIPEIRNLLKTYSHILTHKRISFFKPNDYSSLAKRFIYEAQKKAILLYKKQEFSSDDFLILDKVIFSRQHVQNNFETDLHHNFWVERSKIDRGKFKNAQQQENDSEKLDLLEFFNSIADSEVSDIKSIPR
jgi:hypothetical protein